MAVKDLDDAPAGPSTEDCAKPANAIVRENCLEGSPASEWDVNAAGAAHLQGFATRASYSPGEQVEFKVKSSSSSYRFDIYRLGWYAGLGARNVDSFRPFVPLPQRQPECYVEEETLLVDCGSWSVSGSWTVPKGAVSGVYIARLVDEAPPAHWRTDASQTVASPKFANRHWNYSLMPPCGDSESCPGLDHSYGAQRLKLGATTMMRNALREPHASHVQFVVRDDERKADILFQTIDTTSRAYNTYAAPSTYGVHPLPHHNFTVPPSWSNRRAYKVSYNVPLLTRDTRAVNAVFNAEYPAIRWLERHGYDVQYWTGVDAHEKGNRIRELGRVYVSVGHDEYWSGEQRAHVEAARDQGVHLMFWSGNEVYWKVRWEKSPVDGSPMRTMVVYKESQDSYKIDPAPDVWTGTFRDSRDVNPEGGKPENALTGTIFTVNAWRHDPLEVPWEYSALRFWRNTAVQQLKPGQKGVLLKGLLGHEWDEDIDNGFRPAGLIRLSRTTVDNVMTLVDTGSCFDSGTATHHLTLYKASSGALVFGAGTVQWTWGLDNFHDEVTGANNMLENEYDTRVGVDLAGPDPVVQQATANLFADMGVQPAMLGAGLLRAAASEDTEPPMVQNATVVEVAGGWRVRAWAADTGGGSVAAMEWSSESGQVPRWRPMSRWRGSGMWEAEAAVPVGVQRVWLRAVDDSLNVGPAEELAVAVAAKGVGGRGLGAEL